MCPTSTSDGSCENLLDDRDDFGWGPNNQFKFPLFGTGMLYERFAESLPEAGVHLNKEAVQIDTVAEAGRPSPTARTTDYDDLITTMPLTELCRLIGGLPARDRCRRRRPPPHRGAVRRHRRRRPCPSTKCWMYFPEADSPFYRVTYLSNYSPQMTPGPAITSRCWPRCRRRRYKPENPDDVVDRTIDGMVACELLTPEQAERQDRQPAAAAGAVLVPGPDRRARRGAGRDPAVADASTASTPAAASGRGATRSATPTTR